MIIDIRKENLLSRMSLPGSALQLALFRILLGAQIFYSSNSELFNLLKVVKGTTETETLFPEFIDRFIAANSLPYLTLTVQVLSIFLILGLFTRYILPLLFLSFLLLFSFWYHKFNAPIPWLYIWFPLLILCFSPSADALSVDSLFKITKPEKIKLYIYRWPIELIVGWFAYIYFAAGIAKILPFSKGFGWLDGGTSQGIIHDRFVDSVLYFVFGKPFFDYTQHAWLFAFLSIFALAIELVTIVLFFTNRFNKIIIFLVLAMHLFLFLTGVPGFGQLAFILSICLLPQRVFNNKAVAK